MFTGTVQRITHHVHADRADSVQASIDETTWIIGSLVPGSGKVQLVA